MEESAYRQVLSTSISRPCPFEKSILTRCVACSKAEKHALAEREAVSCSREAGHIQCVALHDVLRHRFAFALHRTHVDGPLPHAQEMRVQCGGLKGLRYALDGSDEVHDVDETVSRARQTFGEWEDFPYEEIVHWAAEHYRYRGNAK